jgi:hypothetical protein
MKRETLHIFDRILKRLMSLSGVAIVQFINGLFDADHPLDSTVEYPNTETVSRDLRCIRSDIVIIVSGIHAYHIEGQIDDDANMAVRVFEYGFAEGLRTKIVSNEGEKISIRFPDARIIYWETTGNTPDKVTLSLEFPEGGCYDYTVKTFKFLNYEIRELEARKLTILLPFYVLKLRKKVVTAKTAKSRQELSLEMKSILEELVAAVERGIQAGLMNATDCRIVLEHMERLHLELYGNYSEFEEANTMLPGSLLTYSEEAALRAREENSKEVARELLANGVSPDIIARSCKLPMETVRGMMN